MLRMKYAIALSLILISSAARADALDDRYQACMSDAAHEPPSARPRPMKWRPGYEHCEADFNDWHERDNAARADPSLDPPNVKVWKRFLKSHPEIQPK